MSDDVLLGLMGVGAIAGILIYAVEHAVKIIRLRSEIRNIEDYGE